ncbi:MAG: hypothetical protein AUJ49_05020 [Desulfovibrionaceae bacterium CG1_02_65_16]|nr:MAG: hypothetical protein AUJ49_05020 [Desulfovibrionaceae bacterium CG1_02_65_16]
MALKCITPPSSLPVTVAEAKEHMVVSTSADDSLIAAFIAAATDAAQGITGRQLVEAEYELVLDQFPTRFPGWLCGEWLEHNSIELPLPPLLSVEAQPAVSSIKYIDAEGVEQTMPTADYTVDADSLLGRVYPAYGKSWPATRAVPNAVRIRYICGWPMGEATSPPVWTGPEAIKTWIKVRVATHYTMREALVQGQAVAELPHSFIDGLLDPWRIYKVV